MHAEIALALLEPTVLRRMKNVFPSVVSPSIEAYFVVVVLRLPQIRCDRIQVHEVGHPKHFRTRSSDEGRVSGLRDFRHLPNHGHAVFVGPDLEVGNDRAVRVPASDAQPTAIYIVIKSTFIRGALKPVRRNDPRSSRTDCSVASSTSTCSCIRWVCVGHKTVEAAPGSLQLSKLRVAHCDFVDLGFNLILKSSLIFRSRTARVVTRFLSLRVDCG